MISSKIPFLFLFHSPVFFVLALQPLPESPVFPTNSASQDTILSYHRRSTASSSSTIGVFPCDGKAGEQTFLLDSLYRITINGTVDGKNCLYRTGTNTVATAPCDSSLLTQWTVTPCTATGCIPSNQSWILNGLDNYTLGIPGAVGPWVDVWSIDNPTGEYHNELWSYDYPTSTIRSLNASPNPPNIYNQCLTIVLPPPPPPPCTLTSRVACHRGIWSTAPSRTPSNGVVDGPLLGNGDIGAAVSYDDGTGGVVYWIGKGDMWATNTDVDQVIPSLHSDTFYTSISGGLVHIFPTGTEETVNNLVNSSSSTATRYSPLSSSSSSLSPVRSTVSFGAVQDLFTASVNLTATLQDALGNVINITYGPSIIASDENTLLIPFTPVSTTLSVMNWSIVVASETSWNLPLQSGVDTNQPSSPVLWTTKQGVTSTDNHMILMPCDTKTYVYYPAISTFTIQPNNLILLSNNTFQDNTANPVCLAQANGNSTKLTIQPCNPSVGTGPTAWQLVSATIQRTGIAPPGTFQLQRMDNPSVCAWKQGNEFHNSGGFVVIGNCADQEDSFWLPYDTVRQQIKYNDTQCLTAIPPNTNITLALAGGIVINAGTGSVQRPLVTSVDNTQSTVSTSTAVYALTMNTTYYIVVTAVASPRDTTETVPMDNRLRHQQQRFPHHYTGIVAPTATKLSSSITPSTDSLSTTDPLALALTNIHTNYLDPNSNLAYILARYSNHASYWTTFWTAITAEVYLSPDHQLLEGFYYGAQYLLACTTRTSEVFPGLWGVFVSDTGGWNGDSTLDYNSQANVYGSCSSNHCEQLIPYLDQIGSDWHLTMSQLRASANWLAKGSAAGPGATSQSMACGYMDQAYENPAICPNNTAGLYPGVEFTTHIGPYAGLYYFADLSLRVVAPMSTKPFIDYVDYTMDIDYLNTTVFPLLESVADFFVAYVELNNVTGYYDIPNSCSQEICGGGPNGETNPHHDIAYLQITLQALVRYSGWLNDRDPEKIQQYQHLLENLPPYPTGVLTKNNATVFVEADDTLSYFGSNGGAYSIVYTAGLHPAEVISLSTVEDNLVNVSWNTLTELALINNWHPLNGLAMMWAPASRVATGAVSETVIDGWENALTVTMYNNFYPDLGGGGIEQAGATEAINSIFVQSQEGFLRFFSMWPQNLNGTFTRIRGRGGFLVAGTFATDSNGMNGQVISPMIITTDWSVPNSTGEFFKYSTGVTMYNCTFLNPWSDSVVPQVYNNNTQTYVDVSTTYINNVMVYTFPTENANTYFITNNT